jgi:hypothetical protein
MDSFLKKGRILFFACLGLTLFGFRALPQDIPSDSQEVLTAYRVSLPVTNNLRRNRGDLDRRFGMREDELIN